MLKNKILNFSINHQMNIQKLIRLKAEQEAHKARQLQVRTSLLDSRRAAMRRLEDVVSCFSYCEIAITACPMFTELSPISISFATRARRTKETLTPSFS